MIQRKLIDYLKEGNKQTLNKKLLKQLKRIANKHSIQYALLWYIYLSGKASLNELYRIYKYLSEKTIRENTVRKQLEQLQRKGLVRKIGDTYTALVDPSEVQDLFDKERSKAGRIGATIRHMKLSTKSLKISPGLTYYTKKTIDESKKLLQKGKRVAVLDLLVHTILPVRENGILWLWHQNVFVYYEPKTKQFRAIKSEEVAKLLKKLGFSEGIMILHVLGHKEASRIIHRIFSRGSYSWPWARSISYGLKELGSLQETTNFKIQLKHIDNRIELILWDLYTKQEICNYTMNWNYEPPEPLKNKQFIIATVLGRQHIKKEIEINNYFSKWKR